MQGGAWASFGIPKEAFFSLEKEVRKTHVFAFVKVAKNEFLWYCLEA